MCSLLRVQNFTQRLPDIIGQGGEFGEDGGEQEVGQEDPEQELEQEDGEPNLETTLMMMSMSSLDTRSNIPTQAQEEDQ